MLSISMEMHTSRVVFLHLPEDGCNEASNVPVDVLHCLYWVRFRVSRPEASFVLDCASDEI